MTNMHVMKRIGVIALLLITNISINIHGNHTIKSGAEPDNKKELIQKASAFILSRAIHTIAKINVADHLIDGPRTIHDLAQMTHTNEDALYRIMRLLASYGIFTYDHNKCFSLTPLAELLTSGHPDSLRAWLMYHDGDEKRWQAYGSMDYSIATGKPAFNHLFGKGYFDLLADNNELGIAFDEGMKNLSQQENSSIANAYDFSSYSCIADIGGGKGSFIAELLMKNKFARGILYDLPHTKKAAYMYLAEQNLSARIECVEGSFFETIPTGADLYVLKRILHDWSDEACLQILRTCKISMSAYARLLIIDAVVTEGTTRDFSKDVDIAMMVLFGGKERTESEWKKLLNDAGFRLIRIYPTSTMLSIIEVETLDSAMY